MNEENINRATFIGTITKKPELDLMEGDDILYKTFINVKRKSKETDCIMIVLDKNQVRKGHIGKGLKVRVEGEIQTRNIYNKYRKRSVLSYVRVFELHRVHSETPDKNHVVLQGRVSKTPNLWTFAKGKRRASFILCKQDLDGRRRSFVPCIAWNGVADVICELVQWEELSFEGMFQSRRYTTENDKEERTTFEVSITKLI